MMELVSLILIFLELRSFQEILLRKISYIINQMKYGLSSHQASNREFKSIIEYLSQFEVKIKKIPSLNELLLSGKSIINPVEINPLDVLGEKS